MHEKGYEYWLQRNWYYHQFMAHFYQFKVPPGLKVLQVGCKTGFILDAVKPRFGVGIDPECESICVAQQKYPYYSFYCTTIEEFTSQENFDYIILSSTIMEVYDIQFLFEQLHRFSHAGTRVIIDSYSHLWEPVLKFLQKIGMRRPTHLVNWISKKDAKNFLQLAGFDVITEGNQLLIPFYIPVISRFFNSYIAILPVINKVCLSQWVIARPKYYTQSNSTVSVVIPCKNEKGNIEEAVKRTPCMGAATELIFVEGHSHDETLQEIKHVIEKYPHKNIRYAVQSATGKGDAVRTGFDMAKHDVLMILDADLTVPPEELPKFFVALSQNQAEFINGSRLVYGMENEAMRFLNLIANYLFGIGFSWLLGQPIKDTLCGTKVLYKKDYERIVQNRSYFGEFDPFGDFDLLFGAAKQNLKIIDLPVHYKARSYGVTQIRRFYHGLLLMRMFWVALWKFKIR